MQWVGLGTDIIEIWRIKKAIEEHKERFLKKIFTYNEVSYCREYSNPYPHFAARFAAKEALFKALNAEQQVSASWQDVEILNDSKGRPQAHLSASLQEKMGDLQLLLSLSHCDDFATATVIIVSNRPLA